MKLRLAMTWPTARSVLPLLRTSLSPHQPQRMRPQPRCSPDAAACARFLGRAAEAMFLRRLGQQFAQTAAAIAVAASLALSPVPIRHRLQSTTSPRTRILDAADNVATTSRCSPSVAAEANSRRPSAEQPSPSAGSAMRPSAHASSTSWAATPRASICQRPRWTPNPVPPCRRGIVQMAIGEAVFGHTP